MRTLKLSLAALFLSIPLAASPAMACPGGKHDSAKKEQKKEEVKKLASASFRVSGMHCEGCADKVKTTLAATTGIVKVEVKLADNRVSVDYDAEKLTPEKIAKIISDLGYQAAAEA